MATSLRVDVSDRELEDLIKYLDGRQLSLPAKQRLLERTISWLKLTDRFGYDIVPPAEIEVTFKIADNHLPLPSTLNTPAPQCQQQLICPVGEEQS